MTEIEERTDADREECDREKRKGGEQEEMTDMERKKTKDEMEKTDGV